MVIDTNLVKAENPAMSTSPDKLREKLLTPGLMSEMRADRIGERNRRLRGNRNDVVQLVSRIDPARLPWREWSVS